ncbi:hypothetical protein NSP_48200 [Nodularia spumigena CCY9414]|nr:hypothetical protein NSP_48200 [Nodularia spumigena CCY9414]
MAVKTAADNNENQTDNLSPLPLRASAPLRETNLIHSPT